MTSRLHLVRWKPIIKNTRGFADTELLIGMMIPEIPVQSSHGRIWAALPAKPQLSQDGQPRRVDSKIAYSPVLELRISRLCEAFFDRVAEVVRQQHPDALQ
jgi:hypothetical protein